MRIAFYLAIAVAGFVLIGCAAGPSAAQRTVEQFRAKLAAEDYADAQAMMSPDARRWFDVKQGEGMPWSVGSGSTGPWAAWDKHFNKRSEIIQWESGENQVAMVYRETNDYFLLLDRGWVTNRNTYFLDDDGRLVGLLVAPADTGARPQGRTTEFLTWARANNPEELAALMPNGNVDPSGDHPQRMRALLNQWRADSGLPPLK